MSKTPDISVWLGSYRANLRASIDAARGDGFRGLHANAVGTELNPAEFPMTARRHLLHHLQGLGLRLQGLAAEFPGLGLTDPARAEERFATLRSVVLACRDMHVNRAIVNIAGLERPGGLDLARQLLAETADLADRSGVVVSVRPAGADLAKAAELLAELRLAPLRLALDAPSVPADPRQSAALLASAALLQLRDVRRSGDVSEEVPLGSGDVDVRAMLRRCAETNEDCALLVRCDAAGRPVDALRRGREYAASGWSGAGR